jgi:hypothetical protein
MKWNPVAGPRCVALTVAGEPTPEQAETLVRAALSIRGEPVWGSMQIDLFPGNGGSLILARPGEAMKVYIADWAMRFLAGGDGGE